jgi:imidazolonepropionase-like amidohydrolase
VRVRLLVLVLAAAGAFAGDTVFTDVAVVPMDRDRILEHRNVVVRDGRIAAIGAEEPPEGATVIDGRGRFLMPGLADLHVHCWYEEELLLFLANGVTTVRNTWGKPMHLRWRDEIERGERLGPVFFTTGDITDGRPPVWQGSTGVASAEEARTVVAAQARDGYREVKIYDRLSLEAYEAVLEEARGRGLRVTGHVPDAVGIDRALGRQDCIEHLDGYFHLFTRWEETLAKELARRTAAAGTWNCPTLVVYEKVVAPDEAERLRARPEMRYVPPRLAATWDPRRDFRFKDMRAEDFRGLRPWNARRRAFVKLLHDAGAPLVLGTDAGNPFVVAGWSAHEELALLVAAGLTPFEALSTATRNAAEYLGDDAGTVAVGNRADLLLLEGNPLEDVRHAAWPAGVMARGRWLPAEEIGRNLDELVASYAAPKDRFREMADLPEGDIVRFEVLWNDVVVGEERFSIVHGDGGSRTVHAQLVNDPPWSDRKTRQVGPEFDDARVVRTDGTLAAWAATWRLVKALEPQASIRLPHEPLGGGAGGTIRITREPDDGGARAFACVLSEPDGERRFTVHFDAGGLPCGFREEMQQGVVVYRRVP